MAKFPSPRTLGQHERKVRLLRVGLVCKADRLVHHSTLGLRVIKKKKKLRIEPNMATMDPLPWMPCTMIAAHLCERKVHYRGTSLIRNSPPP